MCFELVVADSTGLSLGHVSFGPEDRSALLNFSAEFVDGPLCPARRRADARRFVADRLRRRKRVSWSGIQSNRCMRTKGLQGTNPLYQRGERVIGGSPGVDGTVYVILDSGLPFADLRCAHCSIRRGRYAVGGGVGRRRFPPATR